MGLEDFKEFHNKIIHILKAIKAHPLKIPILRMSFQIHKILIFNTKVILQSNFQIMVIESIKIFKKI